MTMVKKKMCNVLICGAGPSGLGAALMLRQRGWKNITVIERKNDIIDYSPGKSFNYQIDGRGQLLLNHVGIDDEHLRRYGLPNDHFSLTFLKPDGESKIMTPPILMKDRKTPYWTARPKFIELLETEVKKDPEITVLTDHRFARFDKDTKGSLVAIVVNSSQEKTIAVSGMVLGCDGVRSKVREALENSSPNGTKKFGMVKHPSPAAQLKFKVLSFPPSFPVQGIPKGVHEHEIAYALLSTYKTPTEKMALFMLPVANAEQPRTANIILHQSHKFWTLKRKEVKDYLKKGFPQVDFDNVVSEEVFEDFLDTQPGQFPVPQYCRSHYGHIESPSGNLPVLLIGDAIHAFPPDLGMGVNSALEDLWIWNKYLDEFENDIDASVSAFEKHRLPESQSLVRLVQKVHPFQYNQVPWRLKCWTLKFITQVGLNKISGGLTGEPGFVLSQHHLMSFTEMERRYRWSQTTFYGFLFLLFALLFSGIWTFMT